MGVLREHNVDHAVGHVSCGHLTPFPGSGLGMVLLSFDGYALRFVEDQTPEIRLAAVERIPDAPDAVKHVLEDLEDAEDEEEIEDDGPRP